MADTLPAVANPTDFDKLPAPLAEAFAAGTPMQQLLGHVLSELGGVDYIVEWAEESPGEFMRLVMAANPAPIQTQGGGGGVHIHMPAGLQPGPLDVVSEQ